MLESLVQLRGRFLQLHSGPQTVRRFGAAADESVDFFLNVDKRLFHGVFRIDRRTRQSKTRQSRSTGFPGSHFCLDVHQVETALCGKGLVRLRIKANEAL